MAGNQIILLFPAESATWLNKMKNSDHRSELLPRKKPLGLKSPTTNWSVLAFSRQGVLLVNFEQFNLDPRIKAGIQSAGFSTPTPIQEQAIPVVLEGRDVLGLAQTGTGKTAAFMLPILQRLTKGPLRRVRALIVAPTRELAEQIYQTSVDLGKQTKIKSVTVYGGVNKKRQINAIQRGVEIVVACPGRLLDLVGDGAIDLSRVEVLVLDEADRMCDMGFLPDIRRIIKLLPKKRQTLFFSATMPKDIRELADTILHNPVTVQIGMIAPAKTVSHALYPVSNGLKKKLLLAMLKETATGRVLIFTRTKRRARFLARDLENKKYRVSALQGNMSQNRRQQAINGFRNGRYDILVATDIAARGIDVSEISHVINYDMPDTVDAYTHRIGRTGRAENSGEAFTFAGPDDATMIRDIEKVLGARIEQRRLPGFNYGSFEPSITVQGRVTTPPQKKSHKSRHRRSRRNQHYRSQRSYSS
jgi:ATP-dependent RNA helicase RhlE